MSPLWVKAKEIKSITGWDAQAMRKARKYGWIRWKKDKVAGFQYDSQSIPETFLVKNNNPQNTGYIVIPTEQWERINKTLLAIETYLAGYEK